MPAQNTSVPPTAPALASVVSGTQKSTRSGQPGDGRPVQAHREHVGQDGDQADPGHGEQHDPGPGRDRWRILGRFGHGLVEQQLQVVHGRAGGHQACPGLAAGEHRVEVKEFRADRGEEAEDRGNRPPPGRGTDRRRPR